MAKTILRVRNLLWLIVDFCGFFESGLESSNVVVVLSVGMEKWSSTNAVHVASETLSVCSREAETVSGGVLRKGCTAKGEGEDSCGVLGVV